MKTDTTAVVFKPNALLDMSESSGASAFGGSKIVCDMDDFGPMKADAFQQATIAVEKYTVEKTISRHIKVLSLCHEIQGKFVSSCSAVNRCSWIVSTGQLGIAS